MRPVCKPRSIIRRIVACSSIACGYSPALCSGPKDWSRLTSALSSRPVARGCVRRGAQRKRCIDSWRKGEDKEAEQKQLYQKLIETAEHMVRQSRRVLEALAEQSEAQAKHLLASVQEVLPLIEAVIVQTRTRVLEGKKVASDQKVLSLFELHTRAIPRHKGGAVVEFGRQVMLDEVDGGIVTRYEILAHPTEHGQAVEAVAHHRALFEHAPNLVAGDRGVHSADTEDTLKAAGVKRVAIPASGKLSEERQAKEHTRAFRRGYRWRAGIEGRIASRRRDYGWRKSRYHGRHIAQATVS